MGGSSGSKVMRMSDMPRWIEILRELEEEFEGAELDINGDKDEER